MNEPILLVMAAGMGSRYGGLKQMDAIGDNGEWLVDFSLYDAHKAGFKKVVFIVREEILSDFKETVGERIKGKLEVDYAIQKLDDLPSGHIVPKGRAKPWGTAHAVYSAREKTGSSPIMVINADDYYGPLAFKEIYNYLKNHGDSKDFYEYCMVAYELQNTVTEHGHVARGVCTVSSDGYLESINERVHIKLIDGGIRYSEDEEKTWVELEPKAPVSLNCWGFTASLMKELESELSSFLETNAKKNPETSEFFLPTVVENLITASKARVKALNSEDKWYGVTYQEDKDKVSGALKAFKKEGLYPQDLWG